MEGARERPAMVTYKSPLHQMTQTTPTCLWNDSADLDELRYAIDNGAVGATCNPVIAVTVLKKEIGHWRARIIELTREMPGATEDQLGWKLVEEMSIRAASLLEPAFAEHRGRNGRLSIQTDPRFYRDSSAILENAIRFNALAPNMIVKIPATKAGIAAMSRVTSASTAALESTRASTSGSASARSASSACSTAPVTVRSSVAVRA